MSQHSETPESERQEVDKDFKKLAKYAAMALIALLIVLTTSIFHIFGPYKGKIVDLETGEPIEGAAVLISFYTEGGIVDSSSSYAHAVETVTDSKGEFRIRSQWVLVFHPLSVWQPDGHITVFKPGYGVYPGHVKAEPRFEVGGTIPENEYVTIKLPKLDTIEERKNNLIAIHPGARTPDSKMRNLLKLKSEERVNIGLSPLPASRLGE